MHKHINASNLFMVLGTIIVTIIAVLS